MKILSKLGIGICLIFSGYTDLAAQEKPLSKDPELNADLFRSGLLHAPLPLDATRSLESAGLKKKVLDSKILSGTDDFSRWSHEGVGQIAFSKIRTENGKGSIVLTLPAKRDSWAPGAPADGDYANYGGASAVFKVEKENWGKYNRIVYNIYPDCEGSRNVHINLYYSNDGKVKIPDEYRREGTHEINLINKQWNRGYIEISELPRDAISKIAFGVPGFGKDRSTGDSLKFYIEGIELQRIADPEIMHGWNPGANRLAYSTTGYALNSEKTAIAAKELQGKAFQLVRVSDNSIVFNGKAQPVKSSIGEFSRLDFSAYNIKGTYQILFQGNKTAGFQIGSDIWENSVWRVLNFIFCERCGYPVPEKHGNCHADIIAEHGGLKMAYNGGWHDAGDLSQQSLQTGDVTFSLLEMANKVRESNPGLYLRLTEEAEWGLDFLLKTRFGDGYRASSAGIVIWTDGLTGNMDDMKARVHDSPFDNFLFSGYEAYAAASLGRDPMLIEHLTRIARQDFDFALKKWGDTGYDHFPVFWEHSYNTSESQFMATASWAASQLYKLTGERYYAEKAAEFIKYTLACQRIDPLKDKDKISGFFYRDKQQKTIVHFNHQSRDQIYAQALIALCESQPQHADLQNWEKSIRLYGNYLKQISQYTYPYGMLPSGVYALDEAQDSVSFNRQHLFPGKGAANDYIKQLQAGVKLDDQHYLKRFPVWFSFRGNAAIHLATGKAAAICGKFLKDPGLTQLGQEQLYWIVGKNPFSQSLIYGEGANYAQQYCPLPGEMVGEIPVGIQTKLNEDLPYWPQANNATYKEVWMTSAGKWLSLVAEYK